MRSEVLARIILFLLLVAAGAAGVLAAAPLLDLAPGDGIDLHARMPENGGWSHETLRAQVGHPLRLRMTSDDVLHGFAIGQRDDPAIDLPPGEWVETSLVFDRPGRYTFYCTRWCGRNHWRMRGTILVEGEGWPVAQAASDRPRYLELGLNLDAPHPAAVIPASPPSAKRGATWAQRLPAWALERETYLETSPADFWQRLRAEPDLADLEDAALWDLVAYAWQRQTSPEALAEAARLYARDCAACHGETGRGDGVMVEGLPRYDPGKALAPDAAPKHAATPEFGDPIGADVHGAVAPGGMGPGDMGLSAPPDFTDPRGLLGASPALLEGKMLRGGMGTGMPYWGPIYTPEQTDALIACLYTFTIDH